MGGTGLLRTGGALALLPCVPWGTPTPGCMKACWPWDGPVSRAPQAQLLLGLLPEAVGELPLGAQNPGLLTASQLFC